MQRRNNRLLLRYLLYYGIILLLPLLILMTTIITLVGRYGMEQNIALARANLQEGAQRVERLADESNKTCLMVLDEVKTMENTWNEHRFSEYKIVEYLMKQKSTNNSIADIIVLDHSKQVFYSTYLAGNADVFEHRYQVSFAPSAYETMQRSGFVRRVMSTLYVPRQQEWTLFVSSPSVMHPEKTAQILYNAEDMKKTIGRTHLFEDDVVALVGDDGAILATSTEMVASSVLENIATGNEDICQVEGQAYRLLRQPIRGGMELLLLINSKSLTASLTVNYVIIGASFLVSLLIGGLIILATLRKTYHPLNHLLTQVQNSYGPDGLPEGDISFGYAYLNEAFESILSENERLKNDLALYTRYAKQLIVLEALSGERLNAQFVLEGNTSRFYQVILARCDIGTASSTVAEEILSFLGANDIITVPGAVDFFIFVAAAESKSTLRVAPVSLEQVLEKRLGRTCEIAMSDIYGDIMDIGRAYASAFEEFHVRNRMQVPAFDYPYDKIGNIHRYLVEDTAEPLVRQVKDIFAEMRTQKVPVVFARCFVLEIINEVVSALMQSGLSGRQLSDEFAAATELVNERASMEMQEVEVLGYILRAFEHLKNHRHKFYSLRERVDAYIDVNYANPDLSIQSIADEMDVSVTYMRNIYRSSSGQNLNDRIWQTRFDHACALLRETDLRVQDIAEAVGYRIASSFIRKFRDTTGRTPGEYRKER